jgi:prepilin-type N-terminal cleavage/methylation domain-containing protein
MRTNGRQERASQSGITLVELLVSMIILSIVSTMLIVGWMSLQRNYAFAAADNKARATARDALDRVSSEIRAAQPPSPTASPFTPFFLGGSGWGTGQYICGPYACVFYSSYNNPLAATQSGLTGMGAVRLTAIWLQTSGNQRNLYWERDTSGNGALGDAGDQKVIIADNVVNATLSPAIPIFTYNLYSGGTYPPPVNTLTGGTGGNVASVDSVQIEIVVDANLAHTPRYIDLRTTVEPRNVVN